MRYDRERARARRTHAAGQTPGDSNKARSRNVSVYYMRARPTAPRPSKAIDRAALPPTHESADIHMGYLHSSILPQKAVFLGVHQKPIQPSPEKENHSEKKNKKQKYIHTVSKQCFERASARHTRPFWGALDFFEKNTEK